MNRAILLRGSPFIPHTLEQEILANTPRRVQKKYPHKVKKYLANIPLRRQEEYERTIEAYRQEKDIKTSRIVYKTSDNQTVSGIKMEWQDAKKNHSLPLVIFNRGGGLECGKLTAPIIVHMLHPLMRSFPCLLLASNYRGNDVGRDKDIKKGKEDYGGADLKDIHALIDIGKRDRLWDGKNVFMVGWSSGGMRTYKVSQQRSDITAAAVIAGVADPATLVKNDPLTKHLFEEIIPGYRNPETRNQELKKRSAIVGAHKITAPYLLLHARDDQVVRVEHTRRMADSLEKCRKEYHFRRFSGDKHNLLPYPRVSYEIAAWFRRHYERPLVQQRRFVSRNTSHRSSGADRNERFPHSDARMSVDAHWRRPAISPIR